jgi:glucosamine--fructose-6-phosphate aminotransferase (isomerizing)
MPASVPHSDFDADGVCVWCRQGFPRYEPLGDEALRRYLEPFHGAGTTADCLVAVSGGKDSRYAAALMKRKFGLRVEAFTYEHAGLTLHARENARRCCAALDIPLHIVSLPRDLHQRSFAAFFTHWLERESLLGAAMVCVACKHLHLLGLQLAHRRRIPLIVWAACPAEVPPFIPSRPAQAADSKRSGMLALAKTLASELLHDRGFRRNFLRYAGVCVPGCLAFEPDGLYPRHRYPSVRQLRLFDYHPWNPARISEVVKACDWSVPPEIEVEWHSDCLFNVYKEYMFQKSLGCSYTDAYLSNQIRLGFLSREEANRQLQAAKAYFARQSTENLAALGLQHLKTQIDVSCFAVDCTIDPACSGAPRAIQHC